MTSWPNSTDHVQEVIHLPLGRANYARVYALQHLLHSLRCRDEIEDTVITVEHDPVFTIGRSGSRANIRISEEQLRSERIPVYDVERGGDITYHGPGQLVVYPIIDLRNYGRDIKHYISRLEQGIIDLLAAFGVTAVCRPGSPGVWVEERKIASIGVSVHHWVTEHGLALNIDVSRDHFTMINPCGMSIEMVSLADLMPVSPEITEVTTRLLTCMAALFNWNIKADNAKRYWEKLDE